MSNPLHNWLESKEVPTAERIIRRVASPESFLENQPSQSQRPSNRRTSTASDGSRYTSATDASSRKSSASTTASSAPSLYGPLPVAEYYLHCPFEFLGCGISYLPNSIETWIAHSLSHFVDKGPPMKSICTICDIRGCVFEANGKGLLEREESWRSRMRHIASHLSQGVTSVRADYFVVEYMHVQRLLSDEDFELFMSRRLSERPDGHQRFVTKDFQTPSTIRKERRDNIILWDQRAEDRRKRKQWC